MYSGFLVRFRPTTPWRIGPDSGARDRVDRIFHSDSLYSAVTNAMARLGPIDEWLAATVQAPETPAVRFSSCFPFFGDTRYVPPPRHLWPPVASGKVRWHGVRFVPLAVVEALLEGRPIEEDRWVVDGPSECLVKNGSPGGPYRMSLRTGAPVDRLTGAMGDLHTTACLEFTSNAGMWAAVAFAGESAEQRWKAPVQTAFRLLADSGFGGERSRGWGRSAPPEFLTGHFPGLILRALGQRQQKAPPAPVTPPAGEASETEPDSAADTPAGELSSAPPPPEVEVEATPAPETAWWLLSLYSPGPADTVEWARGCYSIVERGGRVESPVRSGDEKKMLRMVSEGSVLFAGKMPVGSASDVAPNGFPHPVFRAGFALAIPIQLQVAA